MRTPAGGSGIFRLLGRLAADPSIALYAGLSVAGHTSGFFAIALHFFIRFNIAGSEGARRASNGFDQARRYFFDRHGGLKLHPVNLSKLVPRHVIDAIEFRPSFRRPQFKGMFQLEVLPFRAFWVEVAEPPIPTEWRAYPSSVATQFIFILDEPTQLSVHGRFRVLHELRHVSLFGAGATTSRTVDLALLPVLILSLCALALTGAFIDPYLFLGLLLISVYAVWQIYIAPHEWRILGEVDADSFAFKNLRDNSERQAVLNTCVAVWGPLIEEGRATWLQRLEWKLRIATMRSLLSSEPTKDAFRSLAGMAVEGKMKGFLAHWWAQKTILALNRESGVLEYGAHGLYALTAVSMAMVVVGYGISVAFFWLGFNSQSSSWLYLSVLVVGVAATLFMSFKNIMSAIRNYSELEDILIKKKLV